MDIAKRNQMLIKEVKRNRVAYAYISPFFVLFAIFGLFPILAGFYISFFRWDGLTPMRFQGLGNYINLFNDTMFWTALGNTAIMGILSTIPTLFVGLVLAYILNSKIIKGENIFKTLFFMPMVTSIVAISIVFRNIFGYHFGLINYVLGFLGVDPIGWLIGNGEHIQTTIIIMIFWRWIGWNMVIYLAGMQGISKDVYEAAHIDGAGHVQTFFRITIPLLKPVIVFTLIQSTIGTLNMFTEPFILTNSMNGGLNNQGLTVMMFMLSKAPQGNTLFGYASSIAYVITTIAVVISIILLRVSDDDRKDAKKAARGER
jgi:ABC-type sugar transport system permease subunit